MNLRQFKVLLSLSAALFGPDIAYADEVAPAPAAPGAVPAAVTAPAGGGSDADIIVTAQKRSERLNEVPVSISAFSAETLQKQGVVETRDLQRIVAGFTAATSAVYSIPVYTLRGVGFYDIGVSSVPAVAVYTDEVPLPYSAMTTGASLDVARVEVLKGPQGTLFGENATGGLIDYIPAAPEKSLHAGADLSYGRFNNVMLQGFVTGPLTDTLRMRLSGRYERSDDWQQSITRNAGLGRTNKLVGRLLTVWEPDSNLSITLNLNGWQDHSDTQAAQLFAIDPAIPPAVTPAILNQPLAPHNDRAADWTPGLPLYYRNSFKQAGLKAVYLLGAVNLTSVTAYEDFTFNGLFDTDGSALAASKLQNLSRVRSFTQELRAQGDLGALGWTIGANYQHDKVRELQYGDFSGTTLGVVLDKAIVDEQETATDEAVFGDLSWKLTDSVTAEGGVRYSADKRPFRGCTIDNGSGIFTALIDGISSALTDSHVTSVPGSCLSIGSNGLPGPAYYDLKENNVSWRGALKWKLSSQVLIYGSVSKGFKAGGYPALGATSQSQYAPVKQESVLAYEAGVKSSALARYGQISAAVFYYDYTNKQVRGRFVDPIFGVLESLVNIPKSRVQGTEVQIGWQPPEGLRIVANGSYIDSKVTRSFVDYDPFGVPVDFKGESYPFTPRWQSSADVEYRQTLGGALDGSLGAHLSYQSVSNAAFGGSSIFRIAPYALLDLRASVESTAGWTASIFARNVSNKYYIQGVGYNNDAVVRYTGRPAFYGISFSVRY